MGKTGQRWMSWLAAVVVLAVAGCQSGGGEEAAIRQAIEDHLAAQQNLAMDQMVMDVEQVSVEGERAEAEVVFRTTADATARMGYHYDLAKEGGKWRVAGGHPAAAGSGHPGGQAGGEAGGASGPMMGMPGGSGMSGMPEGHPPVGGPAPESVPNELPEGHPPIGGSE